MEQFGENRRFQMSSSSTTRKVGAERDNGIPVEWVDDDEWNEIERAFDAAAVSNANSSRIICSSSSATAALSMVPSSLLPSPAPAPAPAATQHRFYHHQACPGHSQIEPESLRGQRENRCPSNFHGDGGGGARPWNNGTVGLPAQFGSRTASLGGGGGMTRTQSANGGSELPSNESTRREERAESDSRALESVDRNNFGPGGLNADVFVGPGTNGANPFSKLSEVMIAPNAAEEDGGTETARKQSIRRLPAWMEPAGRFLVSAMENSPSFVEQGRGVSGFVDGVTDAVRVEEAELEEVEKSRRANGEQQTEKARPFWFPLEQPQVAPPWGLQPANRVVADEMKTKLPAMQFRGQIVYSKTESEVSAATDELWRRVGAMQGTARGGAIPIGFDLEWKPTFNRGETERKVAVMQLCLDGRRCDVMHIIYSGIPPSLQNLLETPSTLKVGLGISGDKNKLLQDYQITTRKIRDLSAIANQKMKNSKQWSLSSLAVELTGKEVDKTFNIRCGDWEALPLSEPQLQYAATDAFASLHLYQVLESFPKIE